MKRRGALQAAAQRRRTPRAFLKWPDVPVIARLGVADVRAFGLAWEDCEELLQKLGFAPRVEIVAA